MIWRFFTVTLLAVLLSKPIFAQDLQLSVILSELDAIRTTEKGGDELYFSVTEYSSKEHPRNYLIPEFPMHWLSAHLKDIKNVTLWDKIIKEGEGVSVIFSLIEQEIPPWYLDELIGTVKLKVRNEKGVLKREWIIPNQKDTQPVKQHENEFILDGHSAQYHLFLKLVEGKPSLAQIKDEKAKRAQQKRDIKTHPNTFPGL